MKSGSLADVAAALRSILPDKTAFALWEGDTVPSLYPEEESAVKRAVASRRTEFARGRACARRALADVGAPTGAILVGEHREPIWPEGFVGSISHCEGLVAAVAARSGDVGALGLDAEPARPLPEDVRSAVLQPSELANDGHAQLETVVFSAKESIHKALFPSSGIWMDLLDVEVALDVATGHFSARPSVGAGGSDPRLTGVRGRFVEAGGFVLTLSFLEGPSPRHDD